MTAAAAAPTSLSESLNTSLQNAIQFQQSQSLGHAPAPLLSLQDSTQAQANTPVSATHQSPTSEAEAAVPIAKQHLQQYGWLYNNAYNSDIDIRIGAGHFNDHNDEGPVKTIHCHRCVLATLSTTYRAMFESGNWLESEMTAVDMDYTAATCECVLRHIYCCEQNLSLDIALEVLDAAVLYHLPSLREATTQFLKQNITMETVFDFLGASLVFQEMSLREHCVAFVRRTNAMSSALYCKRQLFALPKDVLIILVEEAVIDSDTNIITQLHKWCVNHCQQTLLKQNGDIMSESDSSSSSSSSERHNPQPPHSKNQGRKRTVESFVDKDAGRDTPTTPCLSYGTRDEDEAEADQDRFSSASSDGKEKRQPEAQSTEQGISSASSLPDAGGDPSQVHLVASISSISSVHCADVTALPTCESRREKRAAAFEAFAVEHRKWISEELKEFLRLIDFTSMCAEDLQHIESLGIIPVDVLYERFKKKVLRLDEDSCVRRRGAIHLRWDDATCKAVTSVECENHLTKSADGWESVVALNRFSEGRHYWVFTVHEMLTVNDCYVGVSMSRTPAQRNPTEPEDASVICYDMSAHQVHACGATVTQHAEKDWGSGTRTDIGIELDFTKQQIRFYHHEQKKVLFTVKRAALPVPLYPYTALYSHLNGGVTLSETTTYLQDKQSGFKGLCDTCGGSKSPTLKSPSRGVRT